MSNNYKFDNHLIESVCQSLIPGMQSLEDDRINVRKRTTNFWFITLAIVFIAGFYLYMRQVVDTQTWVITGVAIVGIAIFYYFYVESPLSDFRDRFKNEVIRLLIFAFLPEAVYESDSHIPMSEYSHSQLFKTSYDRYSGGNYVAGKLDKTSIRFSQLHTEYKTETRSKNGGKQTQWHTIFQGVFMIADANKNFKGHTFILPDVAERVFGGIGKWFQKNFGDSRGQVVYMEDPAFEKKFAVYSTDPVEARYLITPQMQERLLTLSKHVGNDVYVSFISDRLYLAISRSKQMFRADTSLSLLDVNMLKYYASDITDMLAIINILDLNTRIWGRD